jgi:hypothetical protein
MTAVLARSSIIVLKGKASLLDIAVQFLVAPPRLYRTADSFGLASYRPDWQAA